MSPRASPPPTTLRGHWLLCARLAWVAVAISALAIVVDSRIQCSEQLRTL